MFRSMRKGFKGLAGNVIPSKKSNFNKIVMVIIAICFIVTIFYNWGVKDSSSNKRVSNVVVKINKDEIKLDDLKDKYQECYYKYQMYLGENFNPQQFDLVNIAKQELIQEKLQLLLAQKYKIKVSDFEVIETLKKDIFFQSNGKFDPEKYNKAIDDSKYNWNTLLQKIKEGLIREKLKNIIYDFIKISDEEVKDEYIKQNEKIRLKYLFINSQTYQNTISIEEKEIAFYYKQNKNDYLEEEKCKVKYVLFNEADIFKKIKIPEKQVLDYYEEHKSDYQEEATYYAQHILIKIEKDASVQIKEKAKILAQEILKESKLANSFEEFAKKTELKNKNLVKYEDLGYFKSGVMVPSFENAVFSMNKGEIYSEVVQTDFGYHIIKLVDKKDSYYKLFKEVKCEIEEKIRQEKSKEIVKEKAYEFYQKAKRIFGNFDKIASLYQKEFNAQIKITSFFTKEGSIEELGFIKEFNESVFNLKKVSDISSPIKTYKGYLVIKLLEKKKASIPSLKEIKLKVENDLKIEKSKNIAKNQANKIFEELNKNPKWTDIAKKYNIVYEEPTDLITRDGSLPNIGQEKKILYKAFNLKPQQISNVIETEKGFYIISVIEKQKSNDQEFEIKKEEIKKNLVEQKYSQFFRQTIEDLKKKTKIIDYWGQEKKEE
ncbi:MAG: peptidylprolyl isomerase [bacterium]